MYNLLKRTCVRPRLDCKTSWGIAVTGKWYSTSDASSGRLASWSTAGLQREMGMPGGEIP